MANDQYFFNCPNCFVYFSVPTALINARRADGETFYCPNGHSLSYKDNKDNENDRVRRERDRLKQRTAQLEDAAARAQEAAETERRRAAAARGQVTRLKNRAAAGLCPCCNRSFTNLQRHMATKHAGFVAEDVQAEAGRTSH